MNLAQKIGQQLVVGFDGYEVNNHIENLIVNYHAGSVILFERNCKSPEQIFNLIQSLQRLAMKHQGIPLFIMVDQENGIVNRIFDGLTVFPGNMAQTVGATIEQTHDIAYFTGLGLKALGVNFNLAPDIDVNNNPKNPVIGNRSFSDDPTIVAQRGVAAITGYQKANVIATAKHFPGHGDTEVDSHLALPIVEHDLTRLENIELRPFKEAIDAGVKAIMSAHIYFKALENDGTPATLSKNILTHLLREKLAFNGVVMTDCMEMKAIDDIYGTAKATPIAINAGADLICLSHTMNKQTEAFDEIIRAIENGSLSKDTIDESTKRILALKKEIDIESFLNLKYRDVLNQLYQQKYENLADKVSLQSIQIVKNEGLLPINTRSILVIAPNGRALTGADGIRETPNFAEYLATKCNNTTAVKISLQPTEEQIKTCRELAKTHEIVIIGTQNMIFEKTQQTLIKEIQKINKNIILISLRNPHDLKIFPEIPTTISAHEYTLRSMKSLVEKLTLK